MKIALISTPFFRFLQKAGGVDGYSGLEQIVWDLACGLIEKGNRVVVFAPRGDNPRGGFLYECCEPITGVFDKNWLESEKSMWERFDPVLQEGEFDIINGHNWFGFELASKGKNNDLLICHTHHGGLNLPWWKRSRPPFKINLISISEWMAKVYAAQGFTAKSCYNGVNLERYPFRKERGDRLLFVGRIAPFKQPHLAIIVAKKLNMGIDVCGGTFIDDFNYLEQIKRMADGDRVKLHLDAPHEKKVELMQDAKCVLFTSAMGEPFGLVPIECMATGCPVITLNDGAVEEIVKEGGVVCDVFDKQIIGDKIDYKLKRDPVEAMVEAIPKIDSISLDACRKNAERFSIEKMAEAYIQRYKEILSGNGW